MWYLSVRHAQPCRLDSCIKIATVHQLLDSDALPYPELSRQASWCVVLQFFPVPLAVAIN